MNRLQLFFEQTEYFSSIYPSDINVEMTSKILKSALDNYIILTEIVLEAFKHLQEAHLSLFDALVGENACQIRAAMFYHIYTQNKYKVENYTSKIIELQNLLKNLNIGNKKQSLKKILETTKLDIQLPNFIIILALSHVLTITKTSLFILNKSQNNQFELVIKENNQQKSLNKIKFNVTNAFSEKLTKLAKKELSKYSVQYVKEELLSVDGPSSRLFPDEYIKVNPLGLSTLPAYISMNILLKGAISKKAPLVVNIQMIDEVIPALTNHLTILYQCDATHNYVANEKGSIADDSAALVLEAFSIDTHLSKEVFKDMITSKDLINDIILPFFATHHQYSGIEDENVNYSFSDSEFDKQKNKAFELGVCKANPKLCCFYHIYCDTIEQQLSHTESFLQRVKTEIKIIT